MAWIGVDLDGTLAGWGDPHPTDVLTIGPPIAPMVARVKQMLAEGREVRIFTARVGPATKAECHAALCERGYPAHPEYDPVVHDPEHFFLADQRRLIEAWCVEHLGQVLPITATKDFHMVELWGDRCVQVEPNLGTAREETLKGYLNAVLRDRIALWDLLKARGAAIQQADADLHAAVQRYLDGCAEAVER